MADMLKAVTTESAERRGALFYQLCTHLNWIDLYPINPHSLASFRLTFFSSRAKDDPIDSQLLEELVRTHPDRLRPYLPESTTERKLDQYCRQRRSLLDLATKTELKLISTLKQYFPLAVNLFAAVGMKSDIALNFLSRWPTLNDLRRAKAHTVRSFFYAHNSHRVNVPIKIHDHFRRHSSNSAILLSTSGSKRWISMVMADDENSDFVGKRRGTESDKGNRRNFLSGYHAPPLKRMWLVCGLCHGRAEAECSVRATALGGTNSAGSLGRFGDADEAERSIGGGIIRLSEESSRAQLFAFSSPA